MNDYVEDNDDELTELFDKANKKKRYIRETELFNKSSINKHKIKLLEYHSRIIEIEGLDAHLPQYFKDYEVAMYLVEHGFSFDVMDYDKNLSLFQLRLFSQYKYEIERIVSVTYNEFKSLHYIYDKIRGKK